MYDVIETVQSPNNPSTRITFCRNASAAGAIAAAAAIVAEFERPSENVPECIRLTLLAVEIVPTAGL